VTALDPRGLPVGYPFRPEWEVSPRETRSRLAAGAGTILLDCRRQEELQVASVEGAVHIPMDQIEQRSEELETDGGGRDHQVLVICHTGRRSLRVAATLRALGFPNAYSVAGGIDLWSVDIDPRVPRY
jgi:rhodanese-related sulfurtransferase